MDKLKLPVNSISQSGINRHSQKEYESIRKDIAKITYCEHLKS